MGNSFPRSLIALEGPQYLPEPFNALCQMPDILFQLIVHLFDSGYYFGDVLGEFMYLYGDLLLVVIVLPKVGCQLVLSLYLLVVEGSAHRQIFLIFNYFLFFCSKAFFI